LEQELENLMKLLEFEKLYQNLYQQQQVQLILTDKLQDSPQKMFKQQLMRLLEISPHIQTIQQYILHKHQFQLQKVKLVTYKAMNLQTQQFLSLEILG
jgi:hypothetical protein